MYLVKIGFSLKAGSKGMAYKIFTRYCFGTQKAVSIFLVYESLREHFIEIPVYLNNDYFHVANITMSVIIRNYINVWSRQW